MPSSRKAVLDIVSLTPMALRTDSRTLKQIMSVHRLGYSSAVVEGPPSNFPRDAVPVEVISTLPPPSPATPPPPPAAPAPVDVSSAAVPPAPAPAHAADGIRRRARPQVDGSAALVIAARCRHLLAAAAWRGRSFVRRCIRLAIYAPFYFVLKIINFAWIKLIVTKNKLIYNNPAAFIRHVIRYCQSYVIPTLKAAPKSRLYYLHSPYQYPAILIKKIRYGTKYIYDAHDFYSNMETTGLVSDFWARWVVPFETFVEKRCVRGAAAVVTVNDGLAGLIAEKYGVRPVVLRNSHDHRLDEAVDIGIRATLGLGENDVIVVCVGNWKRENGVSQAIEAMAGLEARYHLAFMGAGFPSYATQIETLGLSGRVHFLPPVRPTQVVPFIRSADVGLILYHDGVPGVHWSLPNRFFQPVAAALPILYPELPEIARLAREYALGVTVDTLDAGSIRSGIRDLTDDPELFDACRRNALAAREALSWEQDEIKLAALIADTIGPPPASPSHSQATYPSRP